MVFNIVHSSLQNISNHTISEGNPTDAIFGGEICCQFKIILVSINEKAFKFEPAGFFFKLDLWH